MPGARLTRVEVEALLSGDYSFFCPAAALSAAEGGYNCAALGATDPSGKTALHHAASAGDVAAVLPGKTPLVNSVKITETRPGVNTVTAISKPAW